MPPCTSRPAPPGCPCPSLPAHIAAEAVVPHGEEHQVVVQRRPGPHPPLRASLQRRRADARAQGSKAGLLPGSGKGIALWLVESGEGATAWLLCSCPGPAWPPAHGRGPEGNLGAAAPAFQGPCIAQQHLPHLAAHAGDELLQCWVGAGPVAGRDSQGPAAGRGAAQRPSWRSWRPRRLLLGALFEAAQQAGSWLYGCDEAGLKHLLLGKAGAAIPAGALQHGLIVGRANGSTARVSTSIGGLCTATPFAAKRLPGASEPASGETAAAVAPAAPADPFPRNHATWGGRPRRPTCLPFLEERYRRKARLRE